MLAGLAIAVKSCAWAPVLFPCPKPLGTCGQRSCHGSTASSTIEVSPTTTSGHGLCGRFLVHYI
ncbi:hypothetical protein B0H10DRAFT_2046561 [Mycena sp. CBHHK59/15]|nr:hypothetical protein B0H10DRAFT_2046561 [Mycena sp. CBHHK59/15]